MGYTGEFGYELHFPPEHGPDVWNKIMAAGADIGIVPCGQAALESLRQEAGYLLVGNDHDKSTNPLEAGIAFTVKFGKAGFNGKEALERILGDGVKRRMVWFNIPSGTLVQTGDAVFIGDRQIGSVTSGSYSPTRKSGTAMGYINPEHAIPGAVFAIENQGVRHAASLSVMPLYDPGDMRTRAK